MITKIVPLKGLGVKLTADKPHVLEQIWFGRVSQRPYFSKLMNTLLNIYNWATIIPWYLGVSLGLQILKLACTQVPYISPPLLPIIYVHLPFKSYIECLEYPAP